MCFTGKNAHLFTDTHTPSISPKGSNSVDGKNKPASKGVRIRLTYWLSTLGKNGWYKKRSKQNINKIHLNAKRSAMCTHANNQCHSSVQGSCGPTNVSKTELYPERLERNNYRKIYQSNVRRGQLGKTPNSTGTPREKKKRSRFRVPERKPHLHWAVAPHLYWAVGP